jgi:hypothetical protein
MGLKGGEKITDIAARPRLHRLLHQRAHRGSARGGEDRRAGQKVNARVNAMIVPGSGLVKEQAEAEGLDKIFKEAGFDWREPGCSMCLAMNPDKLAPGERCASTSNRNFEGRQGYKGRTHLVSPRWRRRRRSPGTSSISASGYEGEGGDPETAAVVAVVAAAARAASGGTNDGGRKHDGGRHR